jgi:glycosyltransferase involved in cell wall biosynthesis
VDRPLRVVMPMLTFVPGAMGGAETYARELVRALGARDDVELTVIVSAAAAGSFPGVEELSVDRVRGGPGTADRLRSLVQAMVPDRAVRALMDRADVVHYPFTVAVPRAGRAPWVQTLLDVQHRDLPGMFSSAERAYRALMYDGPARRATRVLTISEFSKRRIVETLNIDPARVDVAHLGVDVDSFADRGDPRQRFVLYPATAWPHKNHARLIAAMAIVRERHPDLRLVLTGGRREALGTLPDWVDHRGHVSEDELRGLFRAASCLAFPSLYEGFGLPVIEAMASGCVVAASERGSLPEICDGAAILFDPDSDEAIAAGILRAIDASDVLRQKGFERAKGFSWASCAAAHAAIYRHAARVPDAAA